jgi:hypothetical protein
MTIKDEILAIKQQSPDGLFHCEAGHDWAKSHPESLLHKALEWDNEKAGYEWRISQIRQLVRLHVVNSDGDPQLVSLSFDRAKDGGYRDIGDVLSDRDLTAILLRDALAELERVQAKYAKVSELAAVWQAADAVKARSRRRKSGSPRESRPSA